MEDLVSIILVNWNGWRDTIECIESVLQIQKIKYNIIIVDNDSHDDSILKIQLYCDGKLDLKSKYFDYNSQNKPLKYSLISKNISDDNLQLLNPTENGIPQITIIRNSKNSGFAIGNNIGIKFSLKNYDPGYILLLNNDTVITPDFLSKMIAVSKKFSNNCLVGPKTLYYDNPDRIWLIGKKLHWFPWNPDQNQLNSAEKEEDHVIVDFIPGSCLLIPTPVIEKIGLLPTEYFLQWEDIDYCTNAKLQNIPNIYVPSSVIYHKVCSSYDRNNQNTLRYKLSGRNKIIFFKKYLTNKNFLLFMTLNFFVIFPILFFSWVCITRNPKIVKAYIDGVIEGLKYKE